MYRISQVAYLYYNTRYLIKTKNKLMLILCYGLDKAQKTRIGSPSITTGCNLILEIFFLTTSM